MRLRVRVGGPSRVLDTKEFGKLTQVDNRRLPDHEDAILQPGDAHDAELLVEEVHPQLLSEQWDVLDDRHAHAPLPVLRELRDRWQERLGELEVRK